MTIIIIINVLLYIIFIIHRHFGQFYFSCWANVNNSDWRTLEREVFHSHCHIPCLFIFVRLSWHFVTFYTWCLGAVAYFLVLRLKSNFMTNSRQKWPPSSHMGKVVVCGFPGYLGFYPSLCRIWVLAECGQRADFIGQWDGYWQKSLKCNCNKSTSSRIRQAESCARWRSSLLCVPGLWRNLSSASHSVSSNEAS